MRLVDGSSVHAVFDDVLSPEEFAFVQRFFIDEPFTYVQQAKMHRVFSVMDGSALESVPYLSPGATQNNGSVPFPSGKAIDILMRLVDDNLTAFQHLIGEKGRDWQYFFGKPFLYPQGTALSWHDDYTGAAGAFIYYAHRRWEASWGGELMIGDPQLTNVPWARSKAYGSAEETAYCTHLDDEHHSQKIVDVGFGRFVMPKPNRLVVIGPGIQHAIKRVEAAAGQNMRRSISGIFVNRAKKEVR